MQHLWQENARVIIKLKEKLQMLHATKDISLYVREWDREYS